MHGRVWLYIFIILFFYGSFAGEAAGGQRAMKDQGPGLITLFMCGDVMTGRGIDQVLPHPNDPFLHEPYVKNAREYVELAEKASGPIKKPAGFPYIWGDALSELERMAPDVKIINSETGVTKSDDYWKGKTVHYRMHPANIGSLTAAGIDYCSLANNHVLDWGYRGLAETLETLKKAGIKGAGAGSNLAEAEAPAEITIEDKGRVVIFSRGTESAGIPPEWAASEDRPGVSLLEDFSDREVRHIRDSVMKVKKTGDIVIVSIHWGSNWGYDIPEDYRVFAHKLIDDAGVDLIHGHSSHHVRGMEVYNGRLIIYGAGDFLNDYEGIPGYEHYRGDLGLMYFAGVDPVTGRLVHLQMTPVQVRNFRVNRASRKDAQWLRDILTREGRQFGNRAELNSDDTLSLHWD